MKKRTANLAVAAAILLSAWSALQAQNGGFRFRGMLSRVLTPNGDTRNDSAIFCLDNPSGSAVDVRIYDLYGALVADLSAPQQVTGLNSCPKDSVVPAGPQFIAWDGRSNGAVVHSGVYLYQVRSEGRTSTGSLVVVR